MDMEATGAVEDTGILVHLVEDDEEDYYLTRMYLESGTSATGQQFNLSWSQHLSDAISALQETSPHVVLLDLNLPDSSGWDTFEKVHELAPDVAVILLTGLADEDLGIEAVKQGAQDYLVKGEVDGNALSRAIRYAIERKAAETSLKRYQDHLEDLVRHRTERIRQTNRELRIENTERRKAEETLREALAKLEEHNKAKSRFVSNVSHELKTPLTSMSYAIENLLRGIVGPVSQRFRTYLEMLNDDCQRLIRTVSDILDLSRIESDRLRLNQSKVAFRHFVERAVGSMAILATQKGVDLEARLDEVTGFVVCDAAKMERVVLNVIQNAIKFTPVGGHVGVRTFKTGNGGEFLVAEVSDTGIGIPPEHLTHVTDRYYRVGEQVSGSGLGLAIAKELLELHGGRIAFDSPPPGADSGTRVSMYLPVVTPPCVLVAMGDEDLAQKLQGFLSSEGYDVQLCGGGQGTLAALQDDTPDAVIMDFGLSGMDGVELLAHVKSDYQWLHLPIVIAISGEIDTMKRELIEGFRLPTIQTDITKEKLLRVLNRAMIEEPLKKTT